MLNVWRLRILDVFERTGTVRATADELALSPSAVSQQLSALEAESGVALFERRGRALLLTPAGAALAERSRDVLESLDEIEAELSDARTEPTGKVRLGGFASSLSPLLIPAVRALASEHPRLEVELLEIEPREAVAALHQGRLDLAVTVDEADGTLVSPALSVTALSSDPLMAVLPAGHPLAGHSSIVLADLAGERWALDHEGTYLGDLVPRECRRAGFEPRVAGRFSSYGVLLAHVAATDSVAVLPELAVDPRMPVVARPVTALADRRIVVASRRGAAARPALRAVVDALALVARS
ncbi:DNA-binding transcriptional LysR family regulator [Microbacteriaceae bacterium SG_E_30_P1]|uniref:DNA-binding transcriptional LysR family regulator n=1 Tax=Antiquaquibacter oligotrophicus TaxID=2880260 RepID=A0ABT6KJN8_9MICO|nr:LysR family transcriptional regulator [Antiquaquibacter oligotrophicus]MDH6180210.1 DNA-binding transcriptional LysR family regulator [Antiquaquibacter oligotrophicus]UDF14043.1 LysR family transcriptional regulator [Antiquaquibacter oligotrophicus]